MELTKILALLLFLLQIIKFILCTSTLAFVKNKSNLLLQSTKIFYLW